VFFTGRVAGRSFPSYNCLTSPSEDYHFKRPSNLTSRIHRFYSPEYSSCTGFTSGTVDLFSIRLCNRPTLHCTSWKDQLYYHLVGRWFLTSSLEASLDHELTKSAAATIPQLAASIQCTLGLLGNIQGDLGGVKKILDGAELEWIVVERWLERRSSGLP
jgi:hypothetical protein